MKYIWMGIACAVFATSTIDAHAQAAADDASRSTARSLGYEGVTAYERGEYSVAADKLERAFKVVKVPTLGLWLARALSKTGKLVEASERYSEVMRLVPSGSQAQAQKQAQAEAAEERSALMGTIPTVQIVIKGAKPDAVEVKIDGTAIPSALLGVPRPINPGNHVVVGKRDAEEKTATVSVTLASTQDVVLDFDAVGDNGHTKSVSPSESGKVGSSQLSPAPETTTAQTKGSWQKTAGWIAIGIGTAGVGFGAVTGVLALQGHKSANCSDNVCLESAWNDADRVNRLRTMSSVGFIAGAVVLGAGTTLLLIAPRVKSNTANVGAFVGINSAGVAGSF